MVDLVPAGLILVDYFKVFLFFYYYYYLKFNSPFMNDSNATALYALFYMIVSIYLLQLKNNNEFKNKYILQYILFIFSIYNSNI